MSLMERLRVLFTGRYTVVMIGNAVVAKRGLVIESHPRADWGVGLGNDFTIEAVRVTVSALIHDIRTTIESAVTTGDINPRQARALIDDVARRLRGRQGS